MCARLAQGEREWERSEEESRARKRTSEHACTLTRSRARMVGTHARRRSAYSAAKTGVRKITNGEQRRESVGSPTWLTNGQSALHHRWISSWFPARYTAFAFTHEKDGRQKEKEEKKAGECTHERRESYKLAKEEERRARRWQKKKRRRETSLHRVSTAPLCWEAKGWRRKTERGAQHAVRESPLDVALWSSQREESLEGRCVAVARRKRESARRGEFLGHAASREGERRTLGERARPLNLEQSGRAISARTRRPVSIVVGFCDRAADGQPPEARQIRATAPRLSRRRDRRRKVKSGRERDRTHSRRLSADRAARSRPVEARGSQHRKTKEGAKPVEDRSRRRSRPRTPCSLNPVHLASRVCSPWPTRDPRSDPRRVRDPAKSYTRVRRPTKDIYHWTPSDPTQADLTRAIFPFVAGTIYLFLPALCDLSVAVSVVNPAVSCPRPDHFPPGPRRPRVYDEVSTRGIGYASPRARAPNCRFHRAWYTWPSRVLGGSRHHSVEKRAASHHVKALRGQSAVRLQRERSQATLPRAQPGMHHDPGEARRLRLRRLRRSVHGRSGDRQAKRWVANVKWIMLTLPLALPIMLYTLLPTATTTTTAIKRGREEEIEEECPYLLHAALPIICILIKLLHCFAIYTAAFSPQAYVTYELINLFHN